MSVVGIPTKSWLKLRLARSRIRRQHYESCFGDVPLKYEEFFHWFLAATELEGDILEFGVAKGGTTCLMAEKLSSTGRMKTIHAFDSFHGFDETEFESALASGDVTDPGQRHVFSTKEYSLQYVEAKLRAFGLQSFVRLYPGLFQTTLQPFLDANRGSRICFSLIDCDLATSVRFCAETIYESVVPGGVILFDDYASMAPGKRFTAYSPGVRKVVDEFVAKHRPKLDGLRNGLYHLVK